MIRVCFVLTVLLGGCYLRHLPPPGHDAPVGGDCETLARYLGHQIEEHGSEEDFAPSDYLYDVFDHLVAVHGASEAECAINSLSDMVRRGEVRTLDEDEQAAFEERLDWLISGERP